jgi:hypothetical protein
VGIYDFVMTGIRDAFDRRQASPPGLQVVFTSQHFSACLCLHLFTFVKTCELYIVVLLVQYSRPSLSDLQGFTSACFSMFLKQLLLSSRDPSKSACKGLMMANVSGVENAEPENRDLASTAV